MKLQWVVHKYLTGSVDLEGRTSVESDLPLGTMVNIEKRGNDC